MSVDQSITGGATDATIPEGSNTNGSAVSVETKPHAGILSDLKKERDKRRELETKFQELERQKLEAEGKKDELIQSYKKQLDGYKQQVAISIKSKVEDQIAMKAKDLGCVDTELLLKTVDVNSVEVDSTSFKITDPDSVALMIDQVRKSKPYLFKQSGPEVRDGLPTNKNAPAKAFHEMSREELVAYANKAGIT
jgi:hypothetical protein